MGRRQFGSVRKLASGRWQASYWNEGGRQVAPDTFHAKAEANRWLSMVDADLARGGWVDPRAGRITFTEYSRSWLTLRTDLRPRTSELYDMLLRLHLQPSLGGYSFARISPSIVRNWFAELSAQSGPGAATAARSYRLLRTILNTAVTDEIIVKNPCQVRGAGTEHSPERPVASTAQVNALADAIAPRFRVCILLAAYCSLRRGELLGLQRGDLDLLHGTLWVRRAVVSLRGGSLLVGEPKTEAGYRRIAIPGLIVPDLTEHLDTYVAAKPDALVFTGEKGGPLRPHVLQAEWTRVRATMGLEDLHLHDLRHSGNTWAAATGASTAELMARLGHASPVAALRYQHATADRDRAIADALSELGARTRAPVVEIDHRKSAT